MPRQYIIGRRDNGIIVNLGSISPSGQPIPEPNEYCVALARQEKVPVCYSGPESTASITHTIMSVFEPRWGCKCDVYLKGMHDAADVLAAFYMALNKYIYASSGVIYDNHIQGRVNLDDCFPHYSSVLISNGELYHAITLGYASQDAIKGLLEKNLKEEIEAVEERSGQSMILPIYAEVTQSYPTEKKWGVVYKDGKIIHHERVYKTGDEYNVLVNAIHRPHPAPDFKLTDGRRLLPTR